MQKISTFLFSTPLPLHTPFLFFPVVWKTYYPKPMLLITPPPPLLTRLSAQITAQTLIFLLRLYSLFFQPTSPTIPHHPSHLPDSSSSAWVLWLEILIRVCRLVALKILCILPDCDPVPSTMGTWQHWFCGTIYVFLPTINEKVTQLYSLRHYM